MLTTELTLRAAGLLTLALIPVNLVAPWKLRYREALSAATPVVRDIFWVHAGYIVLVLLGIGVASIAWARELASGAPWARAACLYLAAFWGIRVLVQLFYYDRDERRRNRGFDIAFLVWFAAMAAAYGWAAAGGRG